MEVVRANGLEIAYERVGAGPPLVLVHGAAVDSRVWRPQLAALADEFTVVAWDEPGAGRSSDVPANFGLADYADCLAVLIGELDLGPAHVAGLSWGGTVALELYRRHPELVATLLLVDTYAGWKGSLPAGEVRARVEGVRQMLAAADHLFDPTLPGLFAGDPPAEVVPLMEAMAADVRPESMRTALLVMAETDQRDLLPRIAVPTRLIWGELDERSPLSVARQFEEALPDAQLVVIPGAGHVSNLEQPEPFNDAVREFCRAHPPRGESPRRPGGTGAEIGGKAMTEHKVGTEEEWQAARDELLAEEKELTRRNDELARKRRELPWVPVEKDYSFETADGTKSLAELFDGRSQLLVYHFMFGPEYEAGCPVCSSIADNLDPNAIHLAARDTKLMLVSRAPLEKLQGYRKRMGWSLDWASTVGGEFNRELGFLYTKEELRSFLEGEVPPAVEYNAEACGVDAATYVSEGPGLSAYIRSDGTVYRTYVTTTRGLEPAMGYYGLLDRTPIGRNEEGEQVLWIRRHDEYEDAP